MPDTTHSPEGITPDTRRRFKREAVFAAARAKGAVDHQERMALMGLKRATYFRLIRGANVRLDKAEQAARALDLTIDELYFEAA